MLCKHKQYYSNDTLAVQTAILITVITTIIINKYVLIKIFVEFDISLTKIIGLNKSTQVFIQLFSFALSFRHSMIYFKSHAIQTKTDQLNSLAGAQLFLS